MQPELFDVVELLTDIPHHTLRAGARGAIVECYPDSTCEVEFTNDAGETTALCPLSSEQFLVIWRAQTRTWLPVAEQVASLMSHLPQDAKQEVLDFARFLHARRLRLQATSAADPTTV
jgi:hypothetical protein